MISDILRLIIVTCFLPVLIVFWGPFLLFADWFTEDDDPSVPYLYHSITKWYKDKVDKVING